MLDFIEALAKLSVPVFVITCMTSAGLGLRLQELVIPLRNSRLILFALIANFIASPAIAFALTYFTPISPDYSIGLLLLGGAAGAPFLPKLTAMAKGDMALSVGMMLLLMLGSVFYIPIVLPLLIPGLIADPWPLLRPLLLTMLLPLAIGMLVKANLSEWSIKVQPVVAFVSNISALIAIALLIGFNTQALLSVFGSGAVAAGILFVVLSFASGYLLRMPKERTRIVLALGTGQRNVAAALLIATENFSDRPGVTMMVLITTLTGLVVLVLAARRFAQAERGNLMAPPGKSDLA